MTSLKVGDLVELRAGTGTVGTVLDVVESHPRWLLVDWHTPPNNTCINPPLENEEFLTLAAGDARASPSAERAGGARDNRPADRRRAAYVHRRTTLQLQRHQACGGPRRAPQTRVPCSQGRNSAATNDELGLLKGRPVQEQRCAR